MMDTWSCVAQIPVMASLTAATQNMLGVSEFYANLATALFESGRIAEAAARFQEAVGLRPASAGLRNRLKGGIQPTRLDDGDDHSHEGDPSIMGPTEGQDG